MSFHFARALSGLSLPRLFSLGVAPAMQNIGSSVLTRRPDGAIAPSQPQTSATKLRWNINAGTSTALRGYTLGKTTGATMKHNNALLRALPALLSAFAALTLCACSTGMTLHEGAATAVGTGAAA